MKLWLDDIRKVPEGYVGVKSVNEAKRLIEEKENKSEEIELLDLDHDLGDYAHDGGDAIVLLDWLRERETYYPIVLHTANVVARGNMNKVIARMKEEYNRRILEKKVKDKIDELNLPLREVTEEDLKDWD